MTTKGWSLCCPDGKDGKGSSSKRYFSWSKIGTYTTTDATQVPVTRWRCREVTNTAQDDVIGEYYLIDDALFVYDFTSGHGPNGKNNTFVHFFRPIGTHDAVSKRTTPIQYKELNKCSYIYTCLTHIMSFVNGFNDKNMYLGMLIGAYRTMAMILRMKDLPVQSNTAVQDVLSMLFTEILLSELFLAGGISQDVSIESIPNNQLDHRDRLSDSDVDEIVSELAATIKKERRSSSYADESRLRQLKHNVERTTSVFPIVFHDGEDKLAVFTKQDIVNKDGLPCTSWHLNMHRKIPRMNGTESTHVLCRPNVLVKYEWCTTMKSYIEQLDRTLHDTCRHSDFKFSLVRYYNTKTKPHTAPWSASYNGLVYSQWETPTKTPTNIPALTNHWKISSVHSGMKNRQMGDAWKITYQNNKTYQTIEVQTPTKKAGGRMAMSRRTPNKTNAPSTRRRKGATSRHVHSRNARTTRDRSFNNNCRTARRRRRLVARGGAGAGAGAADVTGAAASTAQQLMSYIQNIQTNILTNDLGLLAYIRTQGAVVGGLGVSGGVILLGAMLYFYKYSQRYSAVERCPCSMDRFVAKAQSTSTVVALRMDPRLVYTTKPDVNCTTSAGPSETTFVLKEPEKTRDFVKNIHVQSNLTCICGTYTLKDGGTSYEKDTNSTNSTCRLSYDDVLKLWRFAYTNDTNTTNPTTTTTWYQYLSIGTQSLFSTCTDTNDTDDSTKVTRFTYAVYPRRVRETSSFDEDRPKTHPCNNTYFWLKLAPDDKKKASRTMANKLYVNDQDPLSSSTLSQPPKTSDLIFAYIRYLRPRGGAPK